MDLFDQTDFEHMYSVSEINSEIKELVETSLPAIWVQGEISNFTHHSSGHMYFSLKDSQSQITCVMWKSRNYALGFVPADGMKVQLRGNVRVYEKRGSLQLDAVKMVPAGVGDLQFAFEALKNRLNEEGLFSPEFKKELPAFPDTVGIITSPTGAAIQDIQTVLQRRFPSVRMVLRPTIVQGESAPDDIETALHEMNQQKDIDVIILGRGGGSLEDLWAFNDEKVARAIFASHIPIVSAVGHEIDFTISDFVADLRAPTPSAAAELVVPDINEIKDSLKAFQSFFHQHVNSLINIHQKHIKAIISSYGFRRPTDMLHTYYQHIDEIVNVMRFSASNTIKNVKQNLLYQKSRLSDLHPDSILKRGFSITRKANGTLIKQVSDVKDHEALVTQLEDGYIYSKTESTKSN